MASKTYLADAKRFAALFRGFMDAAEALEPIVSIEQATQESQARLSAARKDEVEQAKRHADLVAQGAAVRADADKYHTERMALAEKDAAKVVNEAHQQAKGVIKAAEDQAQRDADARSDQVKSHQAAIADLKRRIDTLTVQHDALTKQRDQRKAELDALTSEHRKVAEAHKQFLTRIGAKG